MAADRQGQGRGMKPDRAKGRFSFSGLCNKCNQQRRRHGLAALVLLALAAPASASFAVPPNAPGQYAPRDECSAKDGGAAFLAALGSAVRARDANALADLASPDIFLDFGGGGGREAVIEMFRGGSDKWKELDAIMALGCAFDEEYEALLLPWFFDQDLGDADPFSTMVTLGDEVPLRERPSRSAKPRARLNWQLVHVYEVEVDDPGYRTVAVIGSDREGYIEVHKLRSQLDYRVRVEKREGEWRITAFVAGD